VSQLHVVVQYNERRITLSAGDVIGRLWSADLCLNDPAISELHAYLSLRDGALTLLPLRGSLRLYGTQVRAVSLTAGQRIEFGPGIHLDVLDVIVPDHLVELQVGSHTHSLLTDVVSVLANEMTAGREHPKAVATVWNSGEQWFARAGHAPPMAIDIDTPVVVAGVLLCLRHTSLQAATVAETTGAGRARPLHIEAQYDSVLIHRPAHPIARFSGIAARIVTTLAEFGGPVHWEVAANEVWIHITERDKLRRRWDRGLSSLRRKLAIAGVRTDLVRTQAGQVELVLAPEDELTVRG
jgi:hypothetical protein